VFRLPDNRRQFESFSQDLLAGRAPLRLIMFWLPTHREVMTASQRISAFGFRVPSPRLPCVELRVCVPRRRETIVLRGKTAARNRAQGVQVRGIGGLAGRFGGSPDDRAWRFWRSRA